MPLCTCNKIKVIVVRRNWNKLNMNINRIESQENRRIRTKKYAHVAAQVIIILSLVHDGDNRRKAELFYLLFYSKNISAST